MFIPRGAGAIDLPEGMTFIQTGSYNNSQLSNTGQAFPYLRTWNGASILTATRNCAWKPRAVFTARYGTSAIAETTVPGYGLFDFAIEGTPFETPTQGIHLTFKIENLFDRPVQLEQYFPLPGRVYSVLVSGNF